MYVVGLTGGIGSGKSTVSYFFKELGIMVYYADNAAKSLMNTSKKLKESIEKSFGKQVYKNNVIDRKHLSSIIFNDKNKLQELNKIVHPEVKKDFTQWSLKQRAPYIIKEAAILFESGSHTDCNAIITVSAPEKIRVERVVNRDKLKREDVIKRIRYQSSEKMKIDQSDFVIYNIGDKKNIREQVLLIHEKILLLSDKCNL